VVGKSSGRVTEDYERLRKEDVDKAKGELIKTKLKKVVKGIGVFADKSTLGKANRR